MRVLAAATLLVLAACASATRQAGPPPAASSSGEDAAARVRRACREGIDKLNAGDAAGAAAELQPAIESPAFQTLEEPERYAALLARGIAAYILRDAGALAYLRQASEMPGATWQAWTLRVHAAWRERDMAEAARSLSRAARLWPAELRGLEPDLVFAIVGESRTSPDRLARMELLDALYDAAWKPAALEPSWMWSDLARLHLERGETPRAAEVARRVRGPLLIIAMKVDRRFDPLLSADPGAFDIELALENELSQLRAAMNSSPRSLRHRLELAQEQQGARRYEQVLDVLEGAASGVETYDDAERLLPWMRDQRSRALKALGRTREAVREMEVASRLPSRDRDPSLKINLGWLYCKLDRPRDALGSVAQVRTEDVSQHGKAELETVRLLAGLELRDGARVKDSLARLRELPATEGEAVQWPLVQAGQLEEASRLMLRRLSDPDLRSEALISVQRYAQDGWTKRELEWQGRWEAFLSRPEVQAAIEKVGRRERFPDLMRVE